MATIINNPDTSGNNSGIGFVVGVILIVLLAALLFVYGLPGLRHSSTSQNGPTVNVPDKINVDVQKQ